VLTVVPDVSAAPPSEGPASSLIDQVVREGARQMLATALQAEVAAYIDQFAGVRDEDGPAPGGAQRLRAAAHRGDQRGCGRGDGAAGERQARRPRYRRADAVILGDLAAVGAQDIGPPGSRAEISVRE
jgi:hypothetical protein